LRRVWMREISASHRMMPVNQTAVMARLLCRTILLPNRAQIASYRGWVEPIWQTASHLWDAPQEITEAGATMFILPDQVEFETVDLSLVQPMLDAHIQVHVGSIHLGVRFGGGLER
jgi:hypothetical protein